MPLKFHSIISYDPVSSKMSPSNPEAGVGKILTAKKFQYCL
jgi:hypothetical protein